MKLANWCGMLYLSGRRYPSYNTVVFSGKINAHITSIVLAVIYQYVLVIQRHAPVRGLCYNQDVE